MGDYDYGRENGLWGEDGIPYGIDDYEPTYRQQSRRRHSGANSVHKSEVESYVALMKELGMTTIVAMNNYLTQYKLWGQFSGIMRENTYASGFTSIGISKDAYREILDLYSTNDVIKTHLVAQKRV